mmetsp:Transcript_32427/g.77016  ORF Transcript_32427/g.77016 Transcript_32427/m.77016 type:complete len:362 (+) Transcript_32427:24-1109(+)
MVVLAKGWAFSYERGISVVDVKTESRSVDGHAPPAEFSAAVVDVRQRLVDLSSERADLAVSSARHLDVFALVPDELHRGDDSRRPRAEHLQQPALRGRLSHLRHCVCPLHHLAVPPLPCQLQDGVPRHSWEDRPVERGGDELLLALGRDPVREEVHRPDLRDYVFVAEEPQHLGVPSLLGETLGEHARRVVPPNLVPAHAPWPRALEAGLSQDLDGREAVLEVGPDRACDYEEQRALARVDAEDVVGAERRGPEVEREPLLVWHPILVHLDELLETGDHRVAVERRQRQPLARPVPPRHVLVRAEEPDGAVFPAVGLHAFEALHAIVEGGRGGEDAQGVHGDDARRGEPRGDRPVHLHHVV